MHRKGEEYLVSDTLSRSAPRLDTIQVKAGTSDSWYKTMLKRARTKPTDYPMRVYKLLLYKHASSAYILPVDDKEKWILVPHHQREALTKEHNISYCGVLKTLERLYQNNFLAEKRGSIPYVYKLKQTISNLLGMREADLTFPNLGFFTSYEAWL